MFRDSKRSESKINSFKTQKEAQEWLNFGVNYEIKTTNKKALDKEGHIPNILRDDKEAHDLSELLKKVDLLTKKLEDNDGK